MWNVYKFTKNGKVSFVPSMKSIEYFNADLNPVAIASNLTEEEANVIFKALYVAFECKDDSEPTNVITVIDVNLEVLPKLAFVFKTKDNVYRLTPNKAMTALNITEISFERLKSMLPFDMVMPS